MLLHSWWAFSGDPEVGLLDYAYTARRVLLHPVGPRARLVVAPRTGAVIQRRRRAARILPVHRQTLTAMVPIFLGWSSTHPETNDKVALATNFLLLQAWPPFEPC